MLIVDAHDSGEPGHDVGVRRNGTRSVLETHRSPFADAVQASQAVRADESCELVARERPTAVTANFGIGTELGAFS